MILLADSMITVLLTSVIIFLLITLLLVVVLLVAKKYLVPSGKVHITINGDTTVEVETGSSLLSTLAAERIYLPSACGGGGSCAQCRCQVWKEAARYSLLRRYTFHVRSNRHIGGWDAK